MQSDFFVGRGSFGEEASSCKVGYRLFGQKKGGLGVKRLSTLYRPFLCKWN